MTISATFINGTQRTRMLVDTEGFCDVPPEATERAATKDHPGRIVISGIKDGVQRVSVDLLYEVKGNSGIDGAASTPTPSEYAQLVLETSENRSAAENAADRAEAAAKRAENSSGSGGGSGSSGIAIEDDGDGNVVITTADNLSWPTVSVKDTVDGANITFTDAKGEDTSVDIYDGEDGTAGADGYTPVKGTDYWTEADKAEIVNEVLSSLTAAEEVSS